MEETRNAGKVTSIINAAQSLFAVHGFEKVSMNEIAEELQISKAALYYYFPDKESICMAVVEKEKSEFISEISSLVSRMDDPEKILRDLSTLRLTYFRRFVNLSRLRQELYSSLRPVFRDMLMKFREREKEIIISILENGMNSGVFRIDDPDKVASLYLDVLKGLGATIIHSKKTITIDQEEFDLLLAKTSLFTDIFIKGLKAN
ncbi:MAG TPA: TetR/AcrR family transcriptional regulator [Bacteroidales bacterium]|nr:TetR/AcrR family transcriptional regulator [Bacteroidales bacterium]